MHLSKPEIEAIETLLSQMHEVGVEHVLGAKENKDLGQAFKRCVEQVTCENRSHRMYSACLEKLSETRTDVPKRLVDSLIAENKRNAAEKQRNKRAARAGRVPELLSPSDEIWKTQEDLAAILNMHGEMLRKKLLAANCERRKDANNPTRFLYSIEDARRACTKMRRRRARDTRPIPITPAKPTANAASHDSIDRKIWMTTQQLAKLFDRIDETIRRALISENAQRVADPKRHGQFLYSIEDAKKIYGDPTNGTLRKNSGSGRRRTSPTPVVLTTTQPLPSPANRSETPTQTTDVLAIYDLFDRKLLTKEQLADALSRLRDSHE